MKKLIFIIFIYTCFQSLAQSNIPILERKLTLKIVNQPLGKILNIISETANFNFSYSSSTIKISKIVTIHAENRTVKEILDQLLNNEVLYQQIGNHLVLQKKMIPKLNTNSKGNDTKPSKYIFNVSGYIRDIFNGNPIRDASIYEKQTLASTTSGDFGYYQMNIVSKKDEIVLHFSNQLFKDTIIVVKYEKENSIGLNVNLISIIPPTNSDMADISDSSVSIAFNDSNSLKSKDTLIEKKNSLYETELGKWFISKYQKLNERNIRDSFYRDWQITFIPPFGTNGRLSSLVTNQFSINALIGYNGGVNGVEFGGLANIIRQDMRGAQFSGISNLVGGQVEGAQFAGISNHVIGNMHGAQFGGIYNYNHHITDGAQFAGIANISRGNMNGLQAAGIVNLAARNSSLLQLGGIANIAKNISGGQIAGIVNIAKKISGFQIGLINIADSSDGITIGLINFIRNGVHQLEFNRNENSMYGLNYRSGTGKLYSILTFSAKFPVGGTSSLMSYGFGLGSNIKLTKKIKFTLDLTSQQLAYNYKSDNLQLHNRFNANLEYKLFNGFSVFGGASINHLIVDKLAPQYNSVFKDFGTQSVWNHDGSYPQHAWVGYQFGVRLF